MRLRATLAVLLLVVIAAPAAAQAAPKDVDAYITAALKRFGQPGAVPNHLSSRNSNHLRGCDVDPERDPACDSL